MGSALLAAILYFSPGLRDRAFAQDCAQPASERLPNVRVKLGDRMLSVPPIFLRDPGFDEAAKAEELTTPGSKIDFSFWMPSRRGEAIRTEPPMDVHEIRSKGACIAPGEYPIVVFDAQFAPRESLDYLFPATIYVRSWNDGKPPKSEPVIGLNKLTFGNYTDDRDIYYIDDHQGASMYMDCDRYHYVGNNSLCNAHVYVWKDQLAFRCLFDSDQKAKWHEVVDAVDQLMTSWKIE